jgi:hypothetical protein
MGFRFKELEVRLGVILKGKDSYAETGQRVRGFSFFFSFFSAFVFVFFSSLTSYVGLCEGSRVENLTFDFYKHSQWSW